MHSVLQEVYGHVCEIWLVGEGLFHILWHILVFCLSGVKLILQLWALDSAEWGAEHLRISVGLVELFVALLLGRLERRLRSQFNSVFLNSHCDWILN